MKRLTRKKEKVRRYREKLRELDDISDALGMSIDTGIRKTVALLNLLGFPTSGSCAGHIDADHGTLRPWVDIQPARGKGLKRKSRQLIKDFISWRRSRGTFLPEGLHPYIWSFPGNEFRIHIGQRLVSNIGKEKKKIPLSVRKWLHKKYVSEMNMFTSYLWERYMKEQ